MCAYCLLVVACHPHESTAPRIRLAERLAELSANPVQLAQERSAREAAERIERDRMERQEELEKQEQDHTLKMEKSKSMMDLIVEQREIEWQVRPRALFFFWGGNFGAMVGPSCET